jgi:type IV pilus assembly protein PilQ
MTMKVFDSRKCVVVSVLLLLSTLVVNGASTREIAVVKDLSFSLNGQSLEFKISAAGEVQYTYFELQSPRRLVVDFHGLENQIGFREKQVESAGVERIRTSVFTDGKRKATRVVFDLTGKVPYEVSDDGGDVVRVVFNPAAEALKASAGAPVNLVAGPAVVPPLEEGKSALSFPRLQIQSTLLQLETPAAAESTAPPAAAQAVEAAASAAPVVTLPRVAAAPPAGQQPTQAEPAPTPQYTGEIISLDLRDVDIKDFFRLIGEITGLNVILDPNVGGTLTILLKDVPWDQALDIVLRNYQFGAQLQGNVLRIATNARLQQEQAEQRTSREAAEQVVDLVSRPIVLNYTRAETVAPTLRTVLTPRGSIIQDLRRNALIITDIPSQFGRVDEMVRFLDMPAQQVEIEARLLSANKSFSREIGAQLGLLVGANSGNVVTGAPGPSSPFSRTPPPRVTSAGGTGGLPLISNFAAPASSGLSFLMQPGSDILLDAIITAAEARGTAKLISRPKVMTQNNQVAVVQQGTQIPVQTNVNNTITTQFLTFALQLQVTPQITDAGTILLNVQIENSQPDFARSVNGVPSISTQRAQTQVLIADGGTAVIGGILVDSDSVNIRQVPGLGSVPIIGNLFKSTQTLKSTSELLFFITSRIKPQDTINLVGDAQQQEAPLGEQAR